MWVARVKWRMRDNASLASTHTANVATRGKDTAVRAFLSSAIAAATAIASNAIFATANPVFDAFITTDVSGNSVSVAK